MPTASAGTRTQSGRAFGAIGFTFTSMPSPVRIFLPTPTSSTENGAPPMRFASVNTSSTVVSAESNT
ncbi:MAG: hypothetical protein QM831_09950 [Kofleriaceae bacterium]